MNGRSVCNLRLQLSSLASLPIPHLSAAMPKAADVQRIKEAAAQSQRKTVPSLFTESTPKTDDDLISFDVADGGAPLTEISLDTGAALFMSILRLILSAF